MNPWFASAVQASFEALLDQSFGGLHQLAQRWPQWKPWKPWRRWRRWRPSCLCILCSLHLCKLQDLGMIMRDLMMSLSRVGEASTKNASEKNTFASKRKSERREGSKQGRDKGRKGWRKHGRKEVMKEATYLSQDTLVAVVELTLFRWNLIRSLECTNPKLMYAQTCLAKAMAAVDYQFRILGNVCTHLVHFVNVSLFLCAHGLYRLVLGFWLYVACALSRCSMCACLVFHLLDFKSMFLGLHSTLQYWDDLSSGSVRLPLYILSKQLCRQKDRFMLLNSGWALSWKVF